MAAAEAGPATPYQLGKFLGRGTWGEVFKATRTADRATVAVKRILHKPELEKNGINFTALREIRLMRELHHPNIVELVDVFVAPAGNSVTGRTPHLHLVLELLATDLQAVLYHKRAPMTPADVKSYLQQMLRGLEYLHQRWVLHRDLKPGNVFISEHGVVKLADFGLARGFALPNQLLSPEVQTLWYRAPELLFGAQEYGAAVDVWSLGCLFAELWYRRPLFCGLEEGAVGPAGEVMTQRSSELDQLGKIFMHLGTPTPELWPDADVLYKYQPFQETKPTPLQLPTTDDSAPELLTGMLRLDPSTRLSATQALAHPYFTNAPAPTEPAALPR